MKKNRFIYQMIVLTSAAFLPALTGAQACPGGGCPGPGNDSGWGGGGFWPGMMGYGGFGWGIFGIIFMFLFWALLITALVYLIKYISSDKQKSQEDEAMKILNERYARGEVSKEEFEKMKKDIRLK